MGVFVPAPELLCFTYQARAQFQADQVLEDLLAGAAVDAAARHDFGQLRCLGQVAGRVLGYDGYPAFDEGEQTLQALYRQFLVFGALGAEHAAFECFLYGVGVAHVHLGGGVLHAVHVHADAAGVARHELDQVFTQPGVCLVQADQRGFTHGKVEQNLLRGYLDALGELLVAVGQQRGGAGREGEAHVGGGIHFTGELRERLSHLRTKNHGTNVVQKAAVENLRNLFGYVFVCAGHDHGLGDFGCDRLDHFAPGVEGMLNPFRLGPCLYRVVVAFNGGHRVQPEVGEVRRVFYGTLEIFGYGGVFAHGCEHLAGLVLHVVPVHAAGAVGCARAGEHRLHLREHALHHSGVEVHAHVLQVFGVDADAEGVLAAFAEERAEGVLCVGGGALAALAGCPCGGVEALFLHLLNEFFEGVALVGGAAGGVLRHVKPFVIRGWA